jgi:mRNA interferase RelE/StbE
LDRPIRRRVEEKLAWFVEHFDEVTASPLGFGFKGFFKLRVGDWRIVYEVKEETQTVVVHDIDHRSKVYKRRP